VTRGMVPHAEFARVYQEADAVFLPTLLECSSAVYPESFVAERPLITSATDFARELCEDGAQYVDPHDPVAAAQVLAAVMEDEKLREQMVIRGHEVLERNYISPEEKWQCQLDCPR